MSTLYLHVGLHKTATTSLQSFFFHNRDKLAKAGIWYPLTGLDQSGAHHHLFSAVRKLAHPFYPPKKSFEDYLDDIRLEIIHYEKVLFSSEILSEIIDYEKLILIKGLCDNIRIIIYLRPQEKTIASQYAHFVRESTLNTPIQDFKYDIPAFNLNFQDTIDKWEMLFGSENIIVRPFEREQYYGGDIFHDFMHVLGLQLTPNYFIPSRKNNISLSRDEIEFKRLANRLADCRWLIPSLDKLSHKRMNEDGYKPYDLFSTEERQSIFEKYRASNTYVAQKYLSSPQLFNHGKPTEKSRLYPGLQLDKITEILEFIYMDNRDTFEKLVEVVFLGLKSNNPVSNQAAVILEDSFRQMRRNISHQKKQEQNTRWHSSLAKCKIFRLLRK